MTKLASITFYCTLIITLFSCQTDRISNLKSVQLRYIFEGNEFSPELVSQATIELINQSDTAIGSDWELYFNLIASNLAPVSSSEFSVQQVNGDLYKIWPNENFQLAGKDTVRFEYTISNPSIKYSDFPSGFYFVNTQNNSVTTVEDLSITVPTIGEKWMRSKDDLVPIPDAQYYYEVNQVSTEQNLNSVPIIPRPKKYNAHRRNTAFNQYNLKPNPLFSNEIQLLDKELTHLLPNLSGDKVLNIEFVHQANLNVGGSPDAYTLSIRGNSVKITAANPKAGFYGMMSFLQLLDPEEYQHTEAHVPEVYIEDYPELSYRGFMLDVGRNFKSKENVLWVIDLLSRYKMNTFHFHITDDEGWRLEIADLPELTSYGAYRGHSPNENDYLYPAYGSGPYAEPSLRNGFYTKADFIEILKYAKERHIEVIPEIDMPGHARAAVRSMEQRYQAYKDTDIEKATEFLLSDLEDQSSYSSIQQYTDNVINVCKPSTYHFFDKIVQTLKAYYEEANAPLSIIHIGGDEVPAGVWAASPDCEKWLAEHQLDRTQLMQDFISRISGILQKYQLTMAGWQEIALNPDHTISTEKSGTMVPYVWNTMPGDPDSPDDSQELAYKLANADFNIVISSAPNLYFDFAYDKHPDEPGFYWSGFVDMRKSFSMQPYDMYTSYFKDPMGHPLSQDHSQKEKLRKKDNILGIQGQLWNETVVNFSALQYYLVPKIYGLFERAWNPEPKWQGKPKSAVFNKDWESFRYQVGKTHIPMLKAFYPQNLHYRIAPPGGLIKEGQLYMNAYWPNLEIKYTTDGSEPDRNAKTYIEPITVSNEFSEIRIKAFDPDGHSSRTIKIIP